MNLEDQIRHLLAALYGQPAAETAWVQLSDRLEHFAKKGIRQPVNCRSLSEKDAILITYADNFTIPGQPPLQTLGQFAEQWLGDVVSGIHILPFYPSSSDDGFSVIDYRRVDPRFGAWEHISNLSQRYQLMFDGVFNHVSQYSAWFQAYLRDEPPYRDYFITAQPEWDLSEVVRPRTLPLLTPFETPSGTHQVWTTFSSDQIDLNFSNPQVLLEIIDILLFYVERGASIIRLDAIAYLWKEPGTSCIHRPQAHMLIKIMRRVLDLVAPQELLISETNVPHNENIRYFGERDGKTGRTDEAQLVYQFPLAPLILHSFSAQDATRLAQWADTLGAPGYFFNFIASHDGIGVQPAYDLLSEAEIQSLVELTQVHGGTVSFKSEVDGQQIPYELNITLYDALNDPDRPDPQNDLDRFMAAQVIMLSLAGVPGIYVHGLLGSRNCISCVNESGRARSINREKFDYIGLRAELEQGQSQRARILSAYRHLLAIRRSQTAFHPEGPQKILFLNPAVFSVARYEPTGAHPLVCLVNVSPNHCPCRLDLKKHNLPEDSNWQDLITGIEYPLAGAFLEVVLNPYQSCWLVPNPKDQ